MLGAWRRLGTGLALVAGCALLAGCLRTPDSVTVFERADVAELPGTLYDRLPPDSQITWTERTLPLIEPRQVLVGPNEALDVLLIRVRVPAPGTDDPPLGVLVPRLNLSTAFPDLLVNGQVVNMDAWAAGPAWNLPFYAEIPRALSAPGPDGWLTLTLRILRSKQPGNAVSRLYVGPAGVTSAMTNERRWIQTTLPQVCALVFLTLGVFALIMWLRFRHEPTYLLFAILTALWQYRTLHYWWFPHGDVVSEWFFWATVHAQAAIMLVAYLFALRLHGRRFPRLEAAGLSLLVLAAIVTLPVFGAYTFSWSPIAYLVQTVVAIGVTVLISLSAWRARSLETGAVAVALWICLGLGVHDQLLQMWLIDIEEVFLLPYGSLFLFTAFLYAVQRRYVAAIKEVEHVNATLEDRLREREQQLARSFRELQFSEQQRAVAGERQRLMREMHDGLGSSLMSSLALFERGQLSPADISAVLRECVDDLKLTIDSLEPIDQDLPTLLGTLRYRLGRRLESTGLTLDWQVTDLPRLSWLDPPSALQLLRLLQESLTNVIKHAKARTLRVTTRAESDEVLLTVADDGVGFDVRDALTQRRGRGLANLLRRAEEIGARVDIDSDDSGTVLTIRLPLQRR